jgi:hypothetical protein
MPTLGRLSGGTAACPGGGVGAAPLLHAPQGGGEGGSAVHGAAAAGGIHSPQHLGEGLVALPTPFGEAGFRSR